MWESAISSHSNDVVPLSLHASDEMSNTISEGIANYYGVSGIPQINVANQNDVYGASAINTAISNNNAQSPVANAVGIMTYEGTSITVRTQTKFFTATTGDYYLATYFMENGLSYTQNGATPDPFIHNHVLRASANNNKWGELVASGSISANTIVNKNYTFTAPSSWNMANVYIALVIWCKSGTSYSYVNAWQSKAN